MTSVTSSDLNWIKDTDNIEIPFDGDLWNRTKVADQLENYISRIKVGATVAIDAEWGAGKSWFVKNWKARLEQNDFKVISLNAFTQDYIEDPFLTIAMEIANALEDDANAVDKIKSSIGEAYRAILPSLPMLIFQVAMTFMGAGKMAKEFTDAFKGLQDDTGAFGEAAAELLNEKLKEHLSLQVDNYQNEKNSLDYFKTQLAEITVELDKPLVFIVDELDRCKPEFAIRLIERIKHFFDIPKVVFVLAVNKTQLEESINSFYGFTSSSNYLEKFIDITVLLKNSITNELNYENIINTYIQKLGITSVGEDESSQIQIICNVFRPNSRQLIRIFNKFALLDNNFDSPRLVFLFLMLIYIELKLIEEFSERKLIESFHLHHFKALSLKFETRKKQLARNNSYQFHDYIERLYSNNGLNGFITFMIFLKFPNDYGANPHGKGQYLLTNNTNSDFVAQWFDYVHLVE